MVAEPPGRGFLFGGLTMSLGLKAAARTVDRDHLVPKSLHCAFVSTGEWGPALDLDVQVVNDSTAFAYRTVTITQRGRLVATVAVSFHAPDTGHDFHVAPPAGPDPSALRARYAHFGAGPAPIELRLLHDDDDVELGAITRPIHPYWARPIGPVGPDPVAADCVTTFVSDYMVVATAVTDAPPPPDARIFTLTHTVWFHRHSPGESWRRYDANLQTLVDGRFLTFGTVHGEDGTRLASFVQEGLVRDPSAGRPDRDGRPSSAPPG